MCAIFGYIAKGKRAGGLPIKTLETIIEANVRRGPHAFGLAWISRSERLMSYRQAGNLCDRLGVLAMARDAKMLIGHLRWATHGSPKQNVNNHPHPCDGGWMVHNGVVSNYEELLETRDLWPSSECDSEVIGQLIERADGNFKERVVSATTACDGPLAMMGLWARPARLIVARSGNPLHYSEGKQGHYFATLADGLPGKPREITDGNVAEYILDDAGGLCGTHKEIPVGSRRTTRGMRPTAQKLLFAADTEYKGG